MINLYLGSEFRILDTREKPVQCAIFVKNPGTDPCLFMISDGVFDHDASLILPVIMGSDGI